jgi:hypothetical protein
MAKEPSGFVADSEFALHLIRGVSLARLAHQKSSEKPFLQRQVRVIEDRASGDGELVITLFAVEELPCRRQFHNGAFASQTFRTIRPTQTNEQLTALFVGAKQVHNVN